MAGHLAAVFVLLVVSGCASAPSAPVKFGIPVMVPCVGEVPARPVYEFSGLALAATDGAKVLALVRDWPVGRLYEERLEAVIAGCR